MLSIQLFDHLVVQYLGVALEKFRSRKIPALLAYLAHTNHPQSREKLADILWSDAEPQQVLSNLRTVLAYLRHDLGEYVISTRSTVSLNQELPLWVDTVEFQQRLSIASRRNTLSPIEAAQVEKGLLLYHGDFLKDFYLPDADSFNEWVLVEQERLRRIAFDAFQSLGDFYLKQGNFQQGIRIVSRWLTFDNLNETAHAGMIQLLAYSGDRAAALAHFQTCRNLLKETLRVEPSPELVALIQRVESGELESATLRVASQPVRMTAAAGSSSIRTNLSTQRIKLFGRDDELAALEKLLRDSRNRLVTIAGPGGIGKTRLALETASLQLTATKDTTSPTLRFPQGVVYIPLAGLTSPGQLVHAVAESLELSLNTGTPLSRQLTDHLKRQNILLVLDNLEHLLPQNENDENTSSDLLDEILKNTNSVTLLVTSREPLGLEYEALLSLRGLPVPEGDETSVAKLQTPSVSLFMERSRRALPDFEVSEEDLTHISRLCRLLGGVPLAIELAAAWMDSLSLADIEKSVQQNIDLLETQARNIPERNRSIRAVFDSTWERLSSAERETLSSLAYFKGGFTLEAVQAAMETSPKVLAYLVKKSLIHFEPHNRRYEIHELLRMYAAEKLSQDPNREAQIKRRMAEYYCRWLFEQIVPLTGANQKKSMQAVDADLLNARQAWNWAIENRRDDLLYLAVRPLHRYYSWRGYHLAGSEECKRAIDALSTIQTPVGKRTLAKLLYWQAQYVLIFGDMAEAQRLRDACQSILDDLTLAGLDTREERAGLLREIAKNLRKSDLPASRKYYEESIELYKELGDKWNVTLSLSWLNDVVSRSGDSQGAETIVRECLALQESLGDRRGASFSLIYLSTAHTSRGNLKEALSLQQRALAYSRELNEQRAVSLALHNMARTQLLVGNFTEAIRGFQESLEMDRQAGGYIHLKDNLLFLGRTCLAKQEFTEAEEYFQQVIELSRDLNHQPTIADAQAFQGLLYLYSGKIAESINILNESLKLSQELGYERGRKIAQSWLGISLLHAGDMDGARECIKQVDDVISTAHLQIALSAIEAECDDMDIQDIIERLRKNPNRMLQNDYLEASALAGIAYRHSDGQQAWQTLMTVFQESISVKAYIPLLYAMTGICLIHIQKDEQDKAARLFAILTAHPFVNSSHWFQTLLSPARTILENPKSFPPVYVASHPMDIWKSISLVTHDP